MSKKHDFDYIIIGSGPAGRLIAKSLAKARKRVAIVESNKFGGSEINSRDIPYGTGLSFAHKYYNLREHPAVSSEDIHFNFPSIAAELGQISDTLSENLKLEAVDSGITIIDGVASFIDPHTIAVGSSTFSASNFVIATGSHLKSNEISGLETVNYLTPDTAFKLRRMPKFIFVVGGGPTGCEIAEYYAKLGTKVIIMERAQHLLPHEEKEVGTTMEQYFKDELGIMVMTESKVVAIEQDSISKRVVFSTNGQEKLVRIDCIVIATGSEPEIENLGLENAKVKYKKTGIVVDKYFQTSAKHIYAIGDAITCKNSSSERSEYEASLLAANILHKSKTPANYDGFIRRIDTDPAVAVVGANEYDLAKRDRKCKKAIVKLSELTLVTEEKTKYGFVKILSDGSGHIIGATIMAPNATLMAEELSVAIRHRINVLSLASTPHISNSFNQAIKLAARKLISKK